MRRRTFLASLMVTPIAAAALPAQPPIDVEQWMQPTIPLTPIPERYLQREIYLDWIRIEELDLSTLKIAEEKNDE